MGIDEVRELLTKLQDIEAHLEILAWDKRDAKKSLLTLEQIRHFADIDVEYDDKVDAAQALLKQTQQEVKRLVMKLGQSVKSEQYHALYIQPTHGWDAKMLDELSFDHIGIEVAKRPKKPYIRLVPR